MDEWNFSEEVISEANEITIGSRVAVHWSEAECQDQEGTVVGVRIGRSGKVEYAVHIDGDISPTDEFTHDRSGLDGGTIRLIAPAPPMTNDKALEAVARVIARDLGGDNYDADDWGVFASTAAKSISAYLSALPGEAEVVAWRWKMLKDKTWTYDPADWFVDKHKSNPEMVFDPLVTLASFQAMQARAEAAERERDEWREALKPSGETKAEYIGEFQFTVTMMELDESDEPYECQRMVTVPWTTIKEIMAAISERAARTALTGGSNG